MCASLASSCLLLDKCWVLRVFCRQWCDWNEEIERTQWPGWKGQKSEERESDKKRRMRYRLEKGVGRIKERARRKNRS